VPQGLGGMRTGCQGIQAPEAPENRFSGGS